MILGYDSGIDYKKEYKIVMKSLNQNNDSIMNFYRDNFMDKLTEYIEKMPSIAHLCVPSFITTCQD